MGKKKMKNSEKKPSHKWRLNVHKTPVASKKEQKQQQQKDWKEMKLEELRGLLELGLDRNDEQVQRLEKEIKDAKRQRAIARYIIKVPINPYYCKEMVASARVNVPEAVMYLLLDKLMDKFGWSYKWFVWKLHDHVFLRVHMRCLQEDAAGLVGLSDETMAEMDPLDMDKLVDGVEIASGERKMKVLVSEFGLGSYPKVEDIITELVEKLAKTFARVAPGDAKAVFAEVAHRDAMALALQGFSLAE